MNNNEQIEMHKRIADLFSSAMRGKIDPVGLRESMGDKSTRIMREELDRQECHNNAPSAQ
jgi:hypothetical protein